MTEIYFQRQAFSRVKGPVNVTLSLAIKPDMALRIACSMANSNAA